MHTGQNYDYELNESLLPTSSAFARPTISSTRREQLAGETIGEVIARSDEVLAAEQPDALAASRRHQLAASRAIAAKRRKIPDLPHGGREPLLRRARARRDQPPDRRPHQRHQPALHGARAPLPACRRACDPKRVIKTGSPMKEVLAHYRAGDRSAPTCSRGSAWSTATTSWSARTARRTSTTQRNFARSRSRRCAALRRATCRAGRRFDASAHAQAPRSSRASTLAAPHRVPEAARLLRLRPAADRTRSASCPTAARSPRNRSILGFPGGDDPRRRTSVRRAWTRARSSCAA